MRRLAMKFRCSDPVQVLRQDGTTKAEMPLKINVDFPETATHIVEVQRTILAKKKRSPKNN
jgi:hypothetical protein